MENNEQKLLERIAELTKENNDILLRLQSRARWGTAFKVFYWLVIIGVSIGTFYFVQPYIDSIGTGLNQLQTDVNTFKKFVK